MSESALMLAVKDQISRFLTVRDARWIDVRPGAIGNPPSTLVSDIFIGVTSRGWDSGPSNNFISELHKIDVTVTIKMADKHVDWWGTGLAIPWDQSLSYAVRTIIGKVHQSWDVINRANDKIDQQRQSSGFCETLNFTGAEGRVERGPEWWNTSTTARSKNTETMMGFSQTIHFGGAKRIQSLDSYN